MSESIKALYEHSRRLWLVRNEVLHKQDDIQLRDIRSKEIAEIKQYHSQPHMVRAGDRHYCERSLQKLLSASDSTRRRWLRRIRKSRDEHKRDGGQQRLLTTYYIQRKGQI
jgi:hypothetical protein